MQNIVFFDLEWANSRNKSICQIGLLSENIVTGNPVYPELNIYVDPNDGFDAFCTAVNHISKARIDGCDTFDKTWPKIEKYFSNAIIIGHNIEHSDLDALSKNLKRYNFSVPTIYYLDTLELAKRFIDPCFINDYSQSTLCKYFDIDVENEHDAFSDACACSDLFKALLHNYDFDYTNYIDKFEPNDDYSFNNYLSNFEIRNELNLLYGRIMGIEIDNSINKLEINYLKEWRDKYVSFSHIPELSKIVSVISSIIDDNIVTIEELDKLKKALIQYVNLINSSMETIASNQLKGIIEGIEVDKDIRDDEIINLQNWLYTNSYLDGHYPYNQLLKSIENILKDNIITPEEKEDLKQIFNKLFDPVSSLINNVIEIENKSFCLTGEFNYGSKNKVNEFIIENGGTINNAVIKATDYVVVGSYGSSRYSNQTYGTKIKKALEMGKIVIKEDDLFKVKG